jgi:Xaa-Pro aminopeptidase
MAIGSEVYEARRRRVLDAIAPGALVVFGTPVAVRNNDIEHPYRQHSDILYLSGFDEPNSALVLASEAEHPFVLFVRPRDPEREVWDGARAGVEGAVRDYGADVAHPIDEIHKQLPELLKGSRRLYYELGGPVEHDRTVLSAVRRLKAQERRGVIWPADIVDPSTLLHEMRLVKASEELGLMQKAADITEGAHRLAMRSARPGMYEYELQALMEAEFRQKGSERVAYESIVGSGPNATVLHYRKNDRQMQDGELVLIDAGCEYASYASDVTRTFPVNGRFSDAQRRVYELVLEAELAGIRSVRPGATLEEVHRASLEVITRGLVELGFIEGPVDVALKEERYKPFFMHRTSHFLGMDVHDVGATHLDGKPRPLAPGMVLTVEPGIYVGVGEEKVPEEYRGIGVRIEDDVVVTETDSHVLSGAIPKTIEDLESVCAK